MTGKDNEQWAAGAARTATGALDHAAIEARARQLRREAAGELFNALADRTLRTWAKVANHPAAAPRNRVSHNGMGK